MKYRARLIPQSGIPLGGIGTGYLELRADGRFYEWNIFNNKPWRGGYPEREEFATDDSLFFAIRVKEEGGEPKVRILRLGVNDLGGDLYRMPWVKNVEEIEYVGEYPLARLRFLDPDLPVAVELEAFSPFIPGNVRDSSMPSAILAFKVRNESSKQVEVTLLGALENCVGKGAASRVCVNEVVEVEGARCILLRAEGVPPDHPTFGGSMALALLKATSHLGLVKAAKEDLWRMWVDLRADGELGSSEGGRCGEPAYGVLARRVVLEQGGEEEFVFVFAWFFPNHIDSSGLRVGHAYENWFSSALDVVRYVLSNLERLRKYTRRFHDVIYDTTLDEWIVDLAASQLSTLVTNSFYTRDFTFGVWEGGPGCCGLGTLDVYYYGSIPLALMFPELEKAQLRLSAKFQLRPGMPQYARYVLAYPENVDELKAEIRRDPSVCHDPGKLEKVLEEIAAKTGKDPTGRMPHFFPGTFSRVDAYHMLDLMPKFALLVYRDYLWTGDKRLLEEMWEKVKLAIENVLRTTDELGQKLPYHYLPSGFEMVTGPLLKPPRSLRELFGLAVSGVSEIVAPRGYTNEIVSCQTYDAWSFLGYSSYLSTIWVAALRAVRRMAEELGDAEYARAIAEVEEEARRNLVRLLWNGEYFRLWNDPLSGLKDECCMADQLNGQWYANLCGLGRVVEEEMARKALRSVLKLNFKPEEGLINGAYPNGTRPSIIGDTTYPNGTGIPWRIGSQPDTPWTGTELAVASLMIQEGMVEEGLRVARHVYERYAKAGMFWNHIECGGHYYRAMDAWALLMALEGFLWNAVRGLLTFAPKVGKKDFKAPFAANGAWGTLAQRLEGSRQVIEIRLAYGSLELRGVEVEELVQRPYEVVVEADGRRLKVSVERLAGRARIAFGEPVRLSEGSVLRITMSRAG